MLPVAATYSDVISTIALVALVPGFGVAIWQIMVANRQAEKAVSVAEATKKAIGDAEANAARTTLSELLPKLEVVERKVRESVAKNAAKEELAGLVAEWRNLSTACVAILPGRSYATDDLVNALRRSAKRATALVAKLPDDPAERAEVIKEFQDSMSGACAQVGAAGVSLRVKLAPED